MPGKANRLKIIETSSLLWLCKLSFTKTSIIKNMAYKMVIIKGLTEDSIKRLSRLTETMDKRFERVDIRLDGMDAHLENMDARLNGMDAHLESVDQRLSGMGQRLTSVDGKLDQVLLMLDRLTPRSE